MFVLEDLPCLFCSDLEVGGHIIIHFVHVHPAPGQEEEEQQQKEATAARLRARGGAWLRRPATLGSGGGTAARDVPGHFLTGWQRSHRPTRTPPAPSLAGWLAGSRGPALPRPRRGGGELPERGPG